MEMSPRKMEFLLWKKDELKNCKKNWAVSNPISFEWNVVDLNELNNRNKRF
jgi:hypothetical protein